MKLLFAGLLLFAASVSHAEWRTDPALFFEKFVSLGQAFDPAMTQLYADTAVIRSVRRYPHGLKRELEMHGDEWKALLLQVLPMARARGDINRFAKVVITRTDAGVTISADRFSALKCYTDENYYLKLMADSDGKLQIVEEYSETQPQHQC